MKPLDETSREVIRAAEALERPPAGDKKRMRRRIGAALAAGVAGPAIGAPVLAKAGVSKLVLGGLGSAGLAVVVGAAVVLSRPQKNDVPLPPPPPPAQVAVAPVQEEDEAEAPDEEPEVAAVDTTQEPEPTKPPGTKKRRKRPTAPVTAVKREPDPPPVVTAPVAEPEKKADTLEAETQGLKEVHAALRAKDYVKSFKLLAEQEAKFPLGQLRQERQAARVLATCGSEPAAGPAALEQFAQVHPGSPLLSRLKAACK